MDAHEIIEARLGHIASHVLAAHADIRLFDPRDMRQAVIDLHEPLVCLTAVSNATRHSK